MSSSLSRAVQEGTNNSSNKSSSKPSSLEIASHQAGKFETCFAQGLDLSEFSSPEHNNSSNVEHQSSKPSVSASSQLLKIKQEESRKRCEQDRQDADMDRVAQTRAQHLRADWQQQQQQQQAKQRISAADVLFLSSSSSSSSPSSKNISTTDRDRSKLMGSLLAQMHQTDATPSTRRSKASWTLMKKQKKQTQLLRGGSSTKAKRTIPNHISSSCRASDNKGGKTKMQPVTKTRKRSKY